MRLNEALRLDRPDVDLGRGHADHTANQIWQVAARARPLVNRGGLETINREERPHPS
jgi:hypothetical protein